MAFYWRENNLYTRHGEHESIDNWTTFLFDMREPIEVNILFIFVNLLFVSLTM
jgi:hypothetical protein